MSFVTTNLTTRGGVPNLRDSKFMSMVSIVVSDALNHTKFKFRLGHDMQFEYCSNIVRKKFEKSSKTPETYVSVDMVFFKESCLSKEFDNSYI